MIEIRRETKDRFLRVWKPVEFYSLIIMGLGGICGSSLASLGLIEISISIVFLYTFTFLTIFVLALLFVTIKIEESNKLIASVIPKVEVELLEDRDAFHKKIEKEVAQAVKSIDVTHFYPHSPEITPAEKSYFETLTKIIKSGDIEVRRLASINNMENYKWVKSTITDHKDALKYHVKYNSHVSDEFPLLNILIVDTKKVFVGVYQEVATPEKAIFIDNETIAKAFFEYYQAVWVESENLKIGNKIFGTTLEKIQEKIEKGADR